MLDKIRSKKILNDIFENLKKKVKIKILKYNKRMLNKFNIKEKDFKDFELIKILKEKYRIKIINDIEAKSIDISDHPYNRQVLLYLYRIQFTNLKELNLSLNGLSDIGILKILKFEKLEILNYSHNNVSDISALDSINYNNLKQLDLSVNYITDIDILEKVKFEKIEKLSLSHNKIINIDVFERVNFPELKSLDLTKNDFYQSNLTVFEKVKFKI